MQNATSGLEQLKQRMRGTWMAGDFGQIARYTAKAAEEFVARLSVSAGMRVLDVACGTGNLAIPAARKGAQVNGIDIAPNLLEQARQRAAEEGLKATFQEGDAEQLPFPDGQYDLVMTMFGAMFAPRPELVASELARVCRPGGAIAMANWTPEGFVGQSFALSGRYSPLPEGVPAPVLWGKENIVHERLRQYTSKIDTRRVMLTFDYPFPPRQVVELFRNYFGPTQVAFSRLDPAGQAAFAADLEKLWIANNQAGADRTLISAEYLEVIASRA
jgi:ubiquinone/menaquinone biosynthesis C-methylase UbiE